jgi:hypothetical protein
MGMVKKTGSAEAENAYGKPLTKLKMKDGSTPPAIIKYDFEWFEYEDDQSMVDAKEELTLEEQRKVVNAARKTTARQAANTKKLDELGFIKPDASNDALVRLKSVYSGIFPKLISKGMSREEAHTEARKRASDLLEEPWPDEAPSEN